VWDDLAIDGPVTIYERGLEPTEEKFAPGSLTAFKMRERHGGVDIPYVPMVQPLRAQAEAFVDAIQSGTPPLSDGRTGVAVVRTLEQMLEV